MLTSMLACTVDAPLLLAEAPVWTPTSTTTQPADSPVDSGTPPADPMVPPGDLEITFMAVGGYLIRYGDDAIMTPPMYTNPNLLDTTLFSVESDVERVERYSADFDLSDVRAILVGHAHYDHLMDAPTLWPRTDDAVFYGNASMAHILAAFAPDRGPECDPETAPDIVIPRDRVTVLDDGLVDDRLCGDGGAGEWVELVGTHARVRALCSEHPAQFGPIHFGPGSIDEDLCEPPRDADDWKEGRTLAFLIDFLDPATGAPVHRVYYQDAPTHAPLGLFAPELLDDKAVDVALLNVGSTDQVSEHPGETLRLMQPRYTVGGHWEDFFRTLAWPVVPILGHDIDAYEAEATAAMDELPPAAEVLVDGVPSAARQWVPMPGTAFVFPPEE